MFVYCPLCLSLQVVAVRQLEPEQKVEVEEAAATGTGVGNV